MPNLEAKQLLDLRKSSEAVFTDSLILGVTYRGWGDFSFSSYKDSTTVFKFTFTVASKTVQ